MLGIRAIQRVKESGRGDGKGYFRIATRQRSAARTGCEGGHETSQGRRSAAQTTSPSHGLRPLWLICLVVSAVWGKWEFNSSPAAPLLAAVHVLLDAEHHLCGTRRPSRGIRFLCNHRGNTYHGITSSQISKSPETISKNSPACLLQLTHPMASPQTVCYFPEVGPLQAITHWRLPSCTFWIAYLLTNSYLFSSSVNNWNCSPAQCPVDHKFAQGESQNKLTHTEQARTWPDPNKLTVLASCQMASLQLFDALCTHFWISSQAKDLPSTLNFS